MRINDRRILMCSPIRAHIHRILIITLLMLAGVGLIFSWYAPSVQAADQEPEAMETDPVPVAAARQLLATLTVHKSKTLPDFQLISPSVVGDQLTDGSPPTQTIQLKAAARGYAGPLPAVLAPVPPSGATPPSGFIDQWQLLFEAPVAELFPHGSVAQADCINFTETDSTAKLATDGLQSWFVCGPFDLRRADKFMVDYRYQLSRSDSHAELFFGVALDGKHFQGVTALGSGEQWLEQQVIVQGVAGQANVWLAWTFAINPASAFDEGVWLDGVQIWRYQLPDMICGNLDPGNKGIVLAPYDPTAVSIRPMVRAEDVTVVERLRAAGVNWVRLGFKEMGGTINLRDYDRMIDTLCAQGISVLGLLNQEMLARQDFGSPDAAIASAYQAEFVDNARFLAGYFTNRVSHWEVWNEANLVEGAFLSPARYAPLLNASYQAIKRANPHAQIILGGLASAWQDSNEYLRALYAELDQTLGGARPFDYLAIHPYPRKQEGPDPRIYMYADRSLGYVTIVDKFLQTMAEHGDGDKQIWITEVGLNSAQASDNHPVCLNAILVEETQQAAYLKAIFDILFHEVTLWGQPDRPAIAKVIWYQYMDVGIADPCHIPDSSGHSDWWFGLYRGDKVTPKPIWCAYQAYPDVCGAAVP